MREKERDIVFRSNQTRESVRQSRGFEFKRYRGDGKWWQLVREAQIFDDGGLSVREVRGIYNLGCLVGEEMRKKTQENQKYEERGLGLGGQLLVKHLGFWCVCVFLIN